MKIKGIEGMTGEELSQELDRGGRFVMYEYCVSLIVVTMRQPSSIFFVRGGDSTFVRGLPYLLVSFIFGWWGIPWGPIYTIATIATNLSGGKDVTAEVLASLRQR